MGDESPHIKKFQKELNAGTTSLLVLSTLSKTSMPMYGYQIARIISTKHEDAPIFKHGVIYPVLRSLEKEALLKSQVEPSTSGPPRRYYQITNTGLDVLKQWTEIWYQLSTFVNKTLEGE
jgi:PadR family transcriptional regulator PadR